MQYKYFNREISWLSYNRRVLDEAADASLQLKERLRFMSIFASNLDEFYKVKIYTYHKLKEKGGDNTLVEINKIVAEQQEEYNNLLFNSIIPELYSEGIELVSDSELSNSNKIKAEEYFNRNIISSIQPVLISKKPNIHFLADNALYLFISLFRKKDNIYAKRKQHVALLKLPFFDYRRFVSFNEGNKQQIFFIEDIVRLNIKKVFPGYDIEGCYSIKMLRNADFQIDDNEEGNIVNKIKEAISNREIGEPCLLEYDRNMPENMVMKLINYLKLSEHEVLASGKYHRLSDLMFLPFSKHSKDYVSKFISHPYIYESKSIFKSVKENDILLHFPFHSFEYITQFLNESAFDKKVKEIKVTWYRVARKSAVANALITAANNGKDVTVFVELKARFDEEQNIFFAEMLQKAGVKIIYTLPGLKVHAKMILVKRIGKKKGERRYVFLSTGNFNEKTANIYTDHGLLTSNTKICNDIYNLFLDIEKGCCHRNYNEILVSPVNIKEEILKKIDREIENHKSGIESGLIFKMNGLQNKKIIDKLYEASIAGVKIELIVRGICCLVPNQYYSKNITVRRIVDHYLEHGRIYIFHNKGDREIFMGSADMMTRNLERRVEVLFPVSNKRYKKEIIDMMDIYLADNTKATYINEKLKNISVDNTRGAKLIRAQEEFRKYINKTIKSK